MTTAMLLPLAEKLECCGFAQIDLAWVEERALAEGAHAFADLDRGRSASAKIVLRPH